MRVFWAASYGAIMNNISLTLTTYRSTAACGIPASESADKHFLRTGLKEIAPFVNELPLSNSARIQFNRLQNSIDTRPASEVIVILSELQRNITAEISEFYYLQLTAKERALFEHKSPLFGSEVAANFPSLAYEIDESAKCLALNRPTAAAFHLLRTLEGGFIAIWRYLGVPDPIKGYERNWSNRLKRVREQFDARWPTAVERNSDEAREVEHLIGALAGMQNPYRNATMHLDQVYTEDDAEHLFSLVRGIMKMIACQMDENGRPLS